MKAKIQFTSAKLVPDKYGNNIQITKIKLMDSNDKYLKFAKLNGHMLDILSELTIDIEINENQ